MFDAGIGGHGTTNERDEPRASSAYLLVYINADDKALFTGNEIFSQYGSADLVIAVRV